MNNDESKYQVKLAFVANKVIKLFALEETIKESYEIPFPENNIKLEPLENKALQHLLDIFRHVLANNEYSIRSFLLSEAIIRACPSHYAAFDYRKEYFNKVLAGDIEFEGRWL
jgi:hypothetical protein